MKHFLPALSLLFGATQIAQAQKAYLLLVPVERKVIQYGFYGSFQASHFNANSSNNYTFRDTGNNTGAGGGAYIDLFFSSRVAFNFGLNTATRGGKFTATYQGNSLGNTPATSVTSTYDLQLRSMYLPLGLKIYTGQPASRTRFYVQGLLATGFLMNATNFGKAEKTYTRPNGKSNTFSYAKHVELLDFNVSAGVGMQHRLTDKLDAFANVQYCYGLVSTQDSPIDYSLNESFTAMSNNAYPLHNVALNVEVGLVYIPFRGQTQAQPPKLAQPDSPIREAHLRQGTSPLADL